MPRAEQRNRRHVLGGRVRRVGRVRPPCHAYGRLRSSRSAAVWPIQALPSVKALVTSSTAPRKRRVMKLRLGQMQPGLGLVAALIDDRRVRLDHGGAQGLGSGGKLRERALGLLGNDGVAVAAGDLGDHGAEAAQAMLDVTSGEETGQATGDQADERPGQGGRGGRHRAGGQHGHGHEAARQILVLVVATHATSPVARNLWRKRCDYLSDSIVFSAQTEGSRAHLLGVTALDQYCRNSRCSSSRRTRRCSWSASACR